MNEPSAILEFSVSRFSNITLPSHIINEYQVASLTDWEAMMKVVATGRFQTYSDEMANYNVPGSQKWLVWRIVK